MKRRWTVVFETDTDPGIIFSDLKLAFGEVVAMQIQPVEVSGE